MRIPKRQYLIFSVVAVIGGVFACGPDFPWQLLDDREVTLKATPTNDFYGELPKILEEPSDSLRASEDAGPDMDYEEQHSKAQDAGLTPDQINQVYAMHDAPDADKAYALGEGLPEAVRLYTTGAFAYHASDKDVAASRFLAVLALPPQKAALRATWAAYMLGKIYGAAGDTAKADLYFAKTRDLALHGAPDPQSLAVASYHEQAGVHFGQADAKPERYAAEMTTAARLYAAAAARGSGWGTQSLLLLAGRVMGDPRDVEAVAADPFMQRLLVLYALTRIPDDGGSARPDYGYSPDFIDGQHPSDAGGGRSNMSLNKSVSALVDAIEKHPVDQLTGKDNLAALMYRAGRYDLSARLVADSSTPIAFWVRAKLAIQKGDLAAAAGFYSQAVTAFDTGGGKGLSEYNVALIHGEQGTLSLARGEYLDAMDKLYSQHDKYWGDIAYLAERVLTTVELKQFVDAHAPPSTNSITAVDLRDLLARRLVRDGRYQDALAYFGYQSHDGGDSYYGGGERDAHIKDHVTAYGKALQVGNSNGDQPVRARAWYDAAVLAREWGMDMMGYEGPPDQHASDGTFPYGFGQEKPGDLFVTVDERKRFAASAPVPDLRFHYRYVATHEMLEAAKLVPPHGQAYAALLCTAAHWMFETPNASSVANDIYRQYVTHGAVVYFAEHFGGDSCPDPDFSETAAEVARKAHEQTAAWIAAQKAAGHPLNRLTPTQRIIGKVRRHLALAMALAIASVLLLAAAGFGGWWLRKRIRSSKIQD